MLHILSSGWEKLISKFITPKKKPDDTGTAATETKIENISLRVKRIESISDKLQTAILEKIGSYGSNLESIKKEMSMMQDSFGKMINPLAERAEEKHHKHLHKTIAHAKKVKRKTSKRK